MGACGVYNYAQGGEPKIALSLYNRQQSQVQFLVPHPVSPIVAAN